MTEPLIDWEFDLGGTRFGGARPIGIQKWDIGSPEIRSQDQPAGFGDFKRFGTDRRTPGLWSFTLLVDAANTTQALDQLEALQTAWDPEDTRLTPGLTVPLRYGLGGRWRRVYGRPRRFTVPTDDLLFGKVPVVCDFELAHLGTFADVPQTVLLRSGSSDISGTGVVFPTTFPRVWGGAVQSPQHTSVVVGGTRSTYLSVDITGPIFKPYIIVSGQVFQLRGGLEAGEHAVVSGVPWAQGVFRQDGTTPSASVLTDSPMEKLRISPGQHTITFGGLDPTGTSTANISFYENFSSI